jgi:hypothetical protein
MKLLKIKCELCDKSYNSLGSLGKHISATHRDIEIIEYYQKYLSTSEGKCKFCRDKARFMGFTRGFLNNCADPVCVKKAQSPFSKEYKMKVDGLTEDEYEKWSIEDRTSKKKNTEAGFLRKRSENPNFDKENSFYCKEYWIKRGYSEEESIKLSYEKTKINRDILKDIINKYPNYQKGKSWNSKEYWMKKGYSEVDSIKIVSEKQSTFSLDKCIEKFGEIEGEKKWRDRQKKWIKTMDNKSEEEKLEILRKKIFYNKVHSKNSQEMFNMVLEKLGDSYKEKSFYATNNGEKQLDLNSADKKVLLKPDFIFENKIIEFFGDYWHCNPLIRNADFKVRRGSKKYTAESIWKIDQWRNDIFISNGYKLLIIWEYEYNSNKEATINKCINFLKYDRSER